MAAFTYAALIAVALLNGCPGAAVVVAGLAYLAHLDKNPIDFLWVLAAERANPSGFCVVEDRQRVVVKTWPLEPAGTSWP
jgi:hypothetical protein